MLSIMAVDAGFTPIATNRRVAVMLVSRRRYEQSLRQLFILLDNEEQERSRDIRFTSRRTAFIAAHGLRRILLSGARRDVAPECWRFETGPYGRPVPTAKMATCDASLSYSGDLAAIAVGRECRVGIDIEIITEADSARPSQPVDAATGREEVCDFLDRWTSREAVAKCLGVGICGEFSNVDFALPPPIPSTRFGAEIPEIGVLLDRKIVRSGETAVAVAVAVSAVDGGAPIRVPGVVDS